jgi:hypothetical protein
MKYCSYFQALVTKKDTWFFVATLRSYEHLAFDRTCDVATGCFEFFVPENNEELFLKLMKHYEQMGIVQNIQKLPNRLVTEEF